MNRRMFLASTIALPFLKIFKRPSKPFIGRVVTGRMYCKFPNVQSIHKPAYHPSYLPRRIYFHSSRINGMASLYKQFYGRQL